MLGWDRRDYPLILPEVIVQRVKKNKQRNKTLHFISLTLKHYQPTIKTIFKNYIALKNRFYREIIHQIYQAS